MGQIGQLFAHLSPLTLVAVVLLVFAVIVAIKIGKALIVAGVLGTVAGWVSLGQGHPPAAAVTHAAIAFAAAAVLLFLITLTRVVALGFLITAVAVGVFLLLGVIR